MLGSWADWSLSFIMHLILSSAKLYCHLLLKVSQKVQDMQGLSFIFEGSHEI